MAAKSQPVAQKHGVTAERPAGALGEWVYRVLLDDIMFQRLPPGTTLGEADLAERLEVSRTPVREGLRRLASEGFVEAVPYKGFSVSRIDLTDLSAIAEVRLEIEPYAARRAVEMATPQEREEAAAMLRSLAPLASMDPAADLERNVELLRLDRRIHTHVYVCTHNRFLTETLVQYHNHSMRIFSLVIKRLPGLGVAVAQHSTLLEALRDGEPEQAEEFMRAHVLQFEHLIRTGLQAR